MRTRVIFIIIFLLSYFLESCEPVVQSLNPLYTEDILIEEPIIEGQWYYVNDSKDSVFWEVKRNKEKRYLIKVNEKNKETEEVYFYLHLIRLKTDIYADIFPLEESYIISNSDPGLFLMSHLTPVHSFSKLLINKNKVVAQYFTSKWLKSVLKKNKNCIDYHKISIGDCEGEKCYLLSSKPQKIQKLLVKYGEENFNQEDNKIIFYKLNTADK